MSGGSYDYFSHKLDAFAREVANRAHNLAERDDRKKQKSLRLAFAKLCLKVAEAARELEWCDSCDTSWEQAEPFLRAIVSPAMELDAARANAQEALDE